MADEPLPLANDPAARTLTGEIKDPATIAAEAKPAEPPAEAKPDTETKPDNATSLANAKKPDAPAVPEKYEFKALGGFEFDEKLIGEASGIFKELGLSQDNAQRLVDFYTKQAKDAAQAPIDFYENMRNNWRNEIIKDPTLGDGSGGLKAEVNATIGRALDALPATIAKPFREAMDLTGAGDNPAFVRALFEISKRLTEGGHVAGSGPSPQGQGRQGQPQTAAQVLYPNNPSSAS